MNDRIYTPLVTLWVFLGQVLSVDHSCRAAVMRLIAHRVSHGKGACSSETSAYCQARKRLPEKNSFHPVARSVGKSLDDLAKSEWLWKGRSVYMFDGTTVTMPDTHRKSSRLSTAVQSETRLGISDRQSMHHDFVVMWCCLGLIHLPLRR